MSKPARKDFLTASNTCELIIDNVDKGMSLHDYLEANKGKTLHYGGCSWIKMDHEKRDIVKFTDKSREDKHTKKLSDAERMAIRQERFKNTPT